MAKREDAKHIAHLPKEIRELLKPCSLPLLVLDADNTLLDAWNIERNKLYTPDMATIEGVDDIFIHNQIRSNAGVFPIQFSTYVKENLSLFPYEKFLVLDKTDEDISYLYFRAHEEYLILSHFFVLDRDGVAGVTNYILNYADGRIVCSPLIGWEPATTDYPFDMMQTLLSAAFLFLSTIASLLRVVEESDLYPVATHGTQHRKANVKKPWQRSDLVTVRYLNRLPTITQHTEPKGGHHASPRYHYRKGTTRKLTNPRFKNHPKYGSEIKVKPSWVGDKEATVNGITYKVL